MKNTTETNNRLFQIQEKAKESRKVTLPKEDQIFLEKSDYEFNDNTGIVIINQYLKMQYSCGYWSINSTVPYFRIKSFKLLSEAFGRIKLSPYKS